MKARNLGLAMLAAACVAGCRSVPEWNAADRETTLEWFLTNEYGKLPKEAEKPDVSFAQVGADAEVLNGLAVRRTVRITVKGPYGSHSFDAHAFVPKAAKRPLPTFIFMGLGARPVDSDLAKITPSWPVEEIVRRGYATVGFNSFDVAPDHASGCTEGIFSVYEQWKPRMCYRSHTAWGTLRAWAWGMSRVMDWIETQPAFDVRHVAIVGHSRGGKTALLAGVTDPRFAMACVNDSGCSGAKLNRMDLPKSENIATITRSFPYWFCNNYRMWVNRDMEIPFDQHQLLALMAPRLVAVASATLDDWAGQRGEFESCRLASGAWEAQGKRGLVADDFPPPECPLQEGSISYHLRTGKHSLDLYDWQCYMDFADRNGWRKSN